LLRALAAQKLRRVQRNLCRHAAGKAVIRAFCRVNELLKDQVADFPAFAARSSNGRFSAFCIPVEIIGKPPTDREFPSARPAGSK
jgi:hypothetical protein